MDYDYKFMVIIFIVNGKKTSLFLKGFYYVKN